MPISPPPGAGPPSGASISDDARRVLGECQAVFESRLSEIAALSLDSARDLLEGASGLGEDDVLDFLGKRTDWRDRHAATMRDLFERRLAGKLRKGRRPDADTSLSSLRVLSATDHDQQASLGGAVAELTLSTRREVAALDLRVAELLGANAEADNPFSIPYIVDGYAAASRAVYPDARVWRRLVLRLLQDLRPHASKLYLALNRRLAEQGILPEAQATLRARGDLAPQDERELFATFVKLIGERGDALDIAVQPTEGAPTFWFASFGPPTDAKMAADAIARHLAALAQPAAQARAAPAPAQEGDTLPSLEPTLALGASSRLFDTLGRWQREDLASSLAGAANDGAAEVPRNLVPHMRNAVASHLASAEDGVAIDVIGLVFQYIFRDPSIPESARDVFARLQVPLVKAALLDRAFFHNGRHPARQFLDRLADASIGLANHAQYREAFMGLASELVDGICDGFTVDATIFRDADRRLANFSDAERSRAASTATAHIAAARTQEDSETARTYLRGVVSDRLSGITVPFELRAFVDTTWLDYMSALAAEGGVDGGGVRGAIATLDDLLWSVAVKERTSERKALAQKVPKLVTALRAGCAATGLPADRMSAFLSTLYDLHMAAIRQDGKAAPPASPEPPLQLHDYVRDMLPGTWLVFGADGSASDARLTHISPGRTRYIFTGRYFSVARVYSPEALAYELGSGRAQVLVEPVPLWDRAVGAALRGLSARDESAAAA